MKKVLITGITGFAGSHLAEYYLDNIVNDIEVWGTRKWRTDTSHINHIEDRIKWKDCDITDSYGVYQIIEEIKPDIIHHLAAMSFVPHSWIYPQQTAKVNIIGSLNFFAAIKQFSPKTIIQVASSSEIYGVQEKLPITEENIPEPCSPYAVSKLAMDRYAAQYCKSFGLNTIITRAFNHTGPRRGAEFVCSTFAKQIAEIEAGLKEPIIKVGNLEAKRDFTDVRDMVCAYVLAVEKCDYGIPYNIATERMVTIQSVLDKLLNYSNVRIEVKQDFERMRLSDLHTLHGCAKKFFDKTDWRPKISLDRTLLDLLDYWRKRIKCIV